MGKAISIIGENGFNLKALKSRPTKELIWSYYFFAEGEGNINSDNGKKMIEELKTKCSEIKVIGSFEKEIALSCFPYVLIKYSKVSWQRPLIPTTSAWG